MTEVAIIRDARTGVTFSGSAGERMYMFTESGKLTYSFHLAPRSIAYGGFAQEWVEADRSGRTPLLMRKGDNLETLKFSFLMVEVGTFQAPITQSVKDLKAISKSNERVYLAYSDLETGLWRITDASASSEYRHAETNEPVRATASLSLTRASDPAVAVGPVTGGAGSGSGGAPAPTPPRTYTVVKGDTLWAIAIRFYGKGTLWPKIFDANRNVVRDPHWIYPGNILVIP